MGIITSGNIKFKSAEYLYSKIKREFKSFGAVNLLDDADFPTYTMNVLNRLGFSALKEEEAILTVRDGKAELPKDLKYIDAAYKCNVNDTCLNGAVIQNRPMYYTDTTYETLRPSKTCELQCQSNDNIVNRVIVRQYLEQGTLSSNYSVKHQLRVSPNVKDRCSDKCLSTMATSYDEITINNGYILTNFDDGDIYLQYYGIALDENSCPMIPDIQQVENAIEWEIKYQILLNFWLVDDLANAVSKWQKAEQQKDMWFAEAKYINKLPSFSKMVDTTRKQRTINKVAYFAQTDNKRS